MFQRGCLGSQPFGDCLGSLFLPFPIFCGLPLQPPNTHKIRKTPLSHCHPPSKTSWCFPKMFLFYFHTLRFGCPNILFPKKKKVGKFISSRVGTVSHIKAGNLSNFTKASKAVAAGGGEVRPGFPLAGFFPPKPEESPPKMMGTHSAIGYSRYTFKLEI